ncbi:methionine gamma-lyase [Alkalihalophilus lindianensis]|uniref:L-methionine gamma-lyase n=1 Tax=Alkalihalophilus lindianensis TaxID=1630542 RepID=A0ABU3X612_9BACI|nr:methionine gamma-lyase [Alkalihalophilus lindianensis]MDV2683326.1 methionine gamma-lyase [Alkalihalophilus lindianensis]
MSSKDSKQPYGFHTLAVHKGYEPDSQTGSLALPIHQTSTFVFPSAEVGGKRFAGEEAGYVYSRLGNPTVAALEEKVAALEKGEKALAFASGMAAISAILLGLVRSGDHILCSRGLYGCTFGFLSILKDKFNVDYTLCDMRDEESVTSSIQKNTKVIYIETPMNPTMQIIDLTMIGRIGKEHQITTVVDNTFMSPYLQRPLEYGCDVVVHSATKYLGGHGDLIAGIAVGKEDFLEEIRFTTLKDIGGILAPFDAFLLVRGIKTLGVRMDRHCQNALEVASFLENHPKVTNVMYPGLKSFPQHELAKKQMDGFGGLISFELKDGLEAGLSMMNKLELLKRAVSLGDVDSLIQHPASMTHSVVPKEERIKMGIADGLIRLSVGIENVEDIINDVQQALS